MRPTLTKLKAILKDNAEDLHKFGVKRLFVFGSVARGESSKSSDIDLLVEFDEKRSIDLFDFSNLSFFLEEKLGVKIDLVTEPALKKQLREQILQKRPFVSPRQKRDWRLRIQDILESIQAIETYVNGLTEETFLTDRKTVDAVIRNFEIIGEAANHVPTDMQKKFSEIPWRNLKDFRNKVAHEYFGVDTNIVWRTIQQRLLPIKPNLEAILQEEKK